MSCPDEAQLIRLVSGELSPDEASVVGAHLRECPACAATRDDLAATWGGLGAWVDDAPDDAPSADLWPQVQMALAREIERESVWLPRTAPALLRAAACIAVAVGLGWSTGAWLLPGERTPDNGPRAEVNLDDALEPLGLDAFVDGPATGLQRAFEESEPEDGQEGVS
jgi:anti-sigma factor RsiW